MDDRASTIGGARRLGRVERAVFLLSALASASGLALVFALQGGAVSLWLGIPAALAALVAIAARRAWARDPARHRSGRSIAHVLSALVCAAITYALFLSVVDTLNERVPAVTRIVRPDELVHFRVGRPYAEIARALDHRGNFVALVRGDGRPDLRVVSYELGDDVAARDLDVYVPFEAIFEDERFVKLVERPRSSRGSGRLAPSRRSIELALEALERSARGMQGAPAVGVDELLRELAEYRSPSAGHASQIPVVVLLPLLVIGLPRGIAHVHTQVTSMDSNAALRLRFDASVPPVGTPREEVERVWGGPLDALVIGERTVAEFRSSETFGYDVLVEHAGLWAVFVDGELRSAHSLRSIPFSISEVDPLARLLGAGAP